MDNELLLRMGVAIFVAINVMMLNSVLYIGYFEEVSARISRLLVFVLWGFATPSVFWCGLSIHKKAFFSLRAKAPTMEVLLSIGILTSYFYSIYIIFINDTHVYFDTSASSEENLQLIGSLEKASNHPIGTAIVELGIIVAVSGYLNPLMAAGAMLISSISVVLNSLRLHAGSGKARSKVLKIFLPWIDFEEAD